MSQATKRETTPHGVLGAVMAQKEQQSTVRRLFSRLMLVELGHDYYGRR